MKHNEKLFKKYGIDKRYHSSISCKDFEGKASLLESPITTTEDRGIEKSHAFQSLNEEPQTSPKSFLDNDHAILRSYLSEEVDRVNIEIGDLLKRKTLRYSKAIKNIGSNKNLKEILGSLIGGKPILFQSLDFKMGSGRPLILTRFI